MHTATTCSLSLIPNTAGTSATTNRKTRTLRLWAIASLSLALSSSWVHSATTYTFQQGVNGYKDAHDTQIRGATPDRQDGKLTSLSADGSDGGRPNHVLLRFANLSGTGANQIPSGGGVVLYSTLTLRINDQGSDQNLHPMLKPWDETTTWNSFDPSDDGVTPDGVEAAVDSDVVFSAPAGTPYFKEIPLKKTTIEDWLSGKTPNYGWVFMPTGNNGVDFSSSDNGTAEFRPKLTIVVGDDGEPFTRTFSSVPDGFSFEVEDGTFKSGKANPIDAASVVVTFDGTKITPQIKKSGTTTTVSFKSPTLLASGSSHTAKLTFADTTSAPPKPQSVEKTFKVSTYALLTPADKVVPDTAKPGFLWRVHQTSTAGTGNTTSRTERQLTGEIREADGTQSLNQADPNAVGGADGPAQPPKPDWAPIEFQVSGVINFSQVEATTTGNFTPDLQMPGIPSLDGGMDSIAAEIITFIELPAGLVTMGVNSDDGFKTTVGPVGEFTDAFSPPQIAGEFSGGRGASDSIFQIGVTEPGVYAFRTIWEEGGGDANIEWFTVKADGTKVLVNDTANGGLKAYRAILSKKAVARRVVPAPNSGGAAYDQTITVELVDGSTPVNAGSITVKLDGAAIAVTPTKAGNVTTINFKAASVFAPKSTHTASVTYTEGTSTVTREWKFVTLNTDLLAYWDFNDASTPTSAKDKIGGAIAVFESGAIFTADGKGRTGKAGDRAAKPGSLDPAVDGLVRVEGSSVAFLNAGGIQNQLAISLWQRLDETRNSSAFWTTGVGQDRAFQAHIPWGDLTIYFDTGGGCCDGTQRINKSISEFPDATNPDTFFLGWHHYVFQKDRDHKQVWIDGKLFHEGDNNSPLPSTFTLLTIGSDSGGGNNTHGDVDDFAVFASALTSAEITKLASGTPPDQVRPVTITPTAPKFTKIAKNADGSITVEWEGGGALQAAPAISGPWQDVAGAASPYTFKPSLPMTFGRIKK